MADTSPNLGLPYILPSQAQKHVTHNAAIDTLDALVQLSVQSRTVAVPPATPTLGQCYIIPAGSSGDWAGHDAEIAIWYDTYWVFQTPQAGWQAHVIDEAVSSVFDGAFWGPSLLDLQNLSHLGLNAVADSANRLTSAAQGTLLTHDGAGHQVKVNKASTGDTASVVFQEDYTGHAEMGLVGSNDFNIKVSPDGSTFLSALAINSVSAITNATCLTSGTITIAKDAVGTIVPPSKSGFVLVLNVAGANGDLDVPRIPHSAIFAYDCGPTPHSEAVFLGSNAQDHGTSVITGTSSAFGRTGFSMQQDAVVLENRATGSRVYSYTFLGGA